MLMASSSLRQRFQQYFLEYRELGFSLDISRMKFPDGDVRHRPWEVATRKVQSVDLISQSLPIPASGDRRKPRSPLAF
jgi:hypothetical protein